VPVEHLYLHVPFCGHRCGYCDFVTVTGNEQRHGRYVDALIADLETSVPAAEYAKVREFFELVAGAQSAPVVLVKQ